eukprot:m.40544 g.40544  ORF g.40544 m.40544 type:complete len:469 (-) comp10355_c0_seq3:32-1438(-)
MAGGGVPDGARYSMFIGSIFVFNLIVGAGALSLPQAFAKAGTIAGICLLFFLAFLSFMSVTFMVEAMSLGNAYLKKSESVNNVSSASEETLALLPSEALASNFAIEKRLEMGRLAEMFFNKIGVQFFYVAMIVYLFGDLCIYAAAVPKSLKTAICGGTGNATVHDTDVCMGSLSAGQSYYVFLAIFAAVLGPFCFTNAQKTLLLQVSTSLFRWMSFIMMIVIATMGISSGKGFDSTDTIPESSDIQVANLQGLSTLFGTSIYAFMCHHSLPSLVTPITPKGHLTRMFLADFGLVFAFYTLLCFTAVFRFQEGKLQDLYNANFKSYSNAFCAYFLALFPVFTLSANFPIIAITLRNNLRTLIESTGHVLSPLAANVGLPLLTLIPPLAVAFGTDNVGLLVGITGSYAGVAIQYVIPAMLCFYGRRQCNSLAGPRPFQSWFRHRYWIFFLMGWSALCLILVTFNHIYTRS